MKNLYIIIFLSFISSAFAQECELVSYRWIGENSVLGKSFAMDKIEEIYLNILPNYKQSHWTYGEGVVTTISYSDSISISLHIGFMMSKPFIKSSANIDSVSNETKMIRTGIENNLYWKEVNYVDLPISIFYVNVPESYNELFNKIIDSVVINLIVEK